MTGKGEELWRAVSTTPADSAAEMLQDEPSFTGERGVAPWMSSVAASSADDHTFFIIAEAPMTSSTFLGDTSMMDVDFFAQTYSVDKEECDHSGGRQVYLSLNSSMLIATRMYIQVSMCVFLWPSVVSGVISATQEVFK